MLIKSADFVIIGGGIIGCSIAYNLAKLGGKNIVVLEKENMLGTGSTAKCSGGVRQQFKSPANIRLSVESLKFFKNWATQFPGPVLYKTDFLETGYLFLLREDSHVEEFKKRVSLQKELGVQAVDFVKLEQMAVALPYINMEGIAAAVFCATDGVADPAGALAEYARQARLLGVSILTDITVNDIGVNGINHKKIEIVFTNKGPILTKCVINAAGPFAANIGKMAGVEIPVVSVRHQTTVSLPVKWLAKNDPFVVDVTPGKNFYFRPETGNMETGYQLLLGGYESGKTEIVKPEKYNEKIDKDFILYLADRALCVFNSEKAEDIRPLPKSGIAGLYETTPDCLPILGRTEKVEGLILANGFSGHGFMHSPAVGKIIAEIALEVSSSFDISGLGLDDFKKFKRAPAEEAVV